MIGKVLHPERYHGHRRNPPFFEGWYFKLVDAGEQHRMAVIPGIFLSEDPDHHHAFVQVLDGRSGEATYHRYPAADFDAARDRFEVRVGPNLFQSSGFELDIDDDRRTVKGRIGLVDPTPWPVSPTSPGIMGWYGWIPWMECNHGVLSLDHGLAGDLEVDGRTMTFDGGRGYVEKDWGASFPRGYVWMQTNHFGHTGTSLVASIAIVPWLFSAFPGFFAGLLHDGRLHRFATYTGAKTRRLQLTDQRVDWVIEGDGLRLAIGALRSRPGLLYGPNRQQMGDRVGETMTASVDVRLTTAAGGILFSGTGRNAGLEIHGDIDGLLALQR